MKQSLLSKIKSKDARIGIVGLGYVGQPLALRYSYLGFKVVGFDIDAEKVERLNSGRSEIEHISDERIKKANEAGFECTSDFSKAKTVDALIICVPTPLNKYREPNLTYVTSTIDSLLPHLREGHVVSLESTTYPGTTEEVLQPKLESTGLIVGENIFLVYSPEREDPGNPNFNTESIPKVVGGVSTSCLEIGEELYRLAVNQVVSVSSTRAAEMTKLLENIHRAVNIGLVNEMKIVADKMGIDIYEVIEAAATKPFGFTAFYPGPGLGGHCIPIDPFYLTWKAREYGLHTRFIELSGEINKGMPDWVVNKLQNALNDLTKPLKSSKVLVLGVAYKKDVDDMRESPSVEIMEILRNKGVNVEYHDPHVPVFPKMREHKFDLKSIDLTSDNIASYDAVLIATNHKAVDYDLLLESANLIVDTRGTYKTPHQKVVKA